MQLCFVPHHGSRKTNANYGIQREPEKKYGDFKLFENFTTAITCERYQVSSGQCSRNKEFHHPDDEVLDIIDKAPGLLKDSKHELWAWHTGVTSLASGMQEIAYTLGSYTSEKFNHGTSVILGGKPAYLHHQYIFELLADRVVVSHRELISI